MASVEDLTHQAGFIFEAELEQLGASTSSRGYPAQPETAVARVTRIIKSTRALAGYTGQQVTIHLQKPVNLQPGQQAVFFTHGIHYGEGLVVNEIGHFTTDTLAMGADYSAAIQASNDTELTQRLAAADLVVTGVASAPKAYTPQLAAVPVGFVKRISEHDPDWQTSTITIETVEKGTHAAKVVEALFPNSMDIAWARSPKIKEGDHGIWLLHHRDVYGKAVPARAATHPLDALPMSETDRKS